MLKSKIICLAAIGVLLTGCGENDQEYYRKNIDKATSKLEQCEKDMEAAIMTQNASEFKKIQNDKECDYAKQAIEEDKIAQKKAAEEAKKADIQRLTNDLTQNIKIIAGMLMLISIIKRQNKIVTPIVLIKVTNV